MILIPVLERELRAEARSAFTYWLRVLGAGALMAPGGLLVLDDGLAPQAGGELFGLLHLTLFGAIWIVVPLMTADCISRERREGTLGLLFLTPLRAFEVVLAKSLAHGLRALALCLAGAPVLVVPFLQGGVSWPEALLSVCVNACALALALGAGVVASAWNKSLGWALGWAFGIAGLLACSLCLGLGSALTCTAWLVFPNLQPDPLSWNSILDISGALLFEHAGLLEWWFSQSASPGAGWWLAGAIATATLTAILALLVLVHLAAWHVKRRAHEASRSAARVQLEKTFCTPTVGVGLYRRWMRRLLNRNPMGWLERRTWQSRLVLWSWVAVLVVLYSVLVPGAMPHGGEMEGMHFILAWLLAGNIALSAAGSFRREREAGVLELLLISPLSVGRIISGRLRGLWGQFLPPGLLLLGFWAWLLHAFVRISIEPWELAGHFAGMGFFAVTWLTIPVTGLYYSLRCRNLVIAWICTLMVGVGLPAGLGGVVSTVARDSAGLLQGGWLAAVSAIAGLGALALALRPLPGLRTLSRLAAVVLFAIGLGAALLPRQADATVLGHLICAAVQLLVAAGLAFGQHQLLCHRRFALPA